MDTSNKNHVSLKCSSPRNNVELLSFRLTLFRARHSVQQSLANEHAFSRGIFISLSNRPVQIYFAFAISCLFYGIRCIYV